MNHNRHNRELAGMILSGALTSTKQAMVPMGPAADPAAMGGDPAAMGMDPAAMGMDPAMMAGAAPPGDPAAMAATGVLPADPSMQAIQQQAGTLPPEGGAPAGGSGGASDPALVESIVAAMQKAGIGANGQTKTFNQWLGEAVMKIGNALGLDIGTMPPDDAEAGGGSSSSSKKK